MSQVGSGLIMKSFVANKESATANRAWWVVDATDKPLGRLASEIASVLRGKHKPTFTTHEDAGDFVIVVNAGKVKLTGNKLDKKFYYSHSATPESRSGFAAEEATATSSRGSLSFRSRRP